MRKPRLFLLAAALAVLPISALAESQVVVLQSAASLTGLAPFFSDVRLYNAAVSHSLDVTATYRCFIGTCPSTPPQATFHLAATESLALDDIVVNTFATPDTGGAVEFAFDGFPNQLVVTSRLYSTSPEPTVGMFVPGVPSTQTYVNNVLTSVRNGGSGDGFRTNVGVFNPGDTAEDVQISLSDGLDPIGLFVFRTVPPHSGVQINQIFAAFGDSGHATQNGVVTVFSHNPVMAYAAVVDNNTQDPYYVVGSNGFTDQPPALRSPKTRSSD